ncbi:MAG: polyamine aminopropyltransferase [Pseudomonadota bacterium]
MLHCTRDHHLGRHLLNDESSASDAGDTPVTRSEAASASAHAALLLATLAIAVCGLVYELLAGTISSYLLGDSVYQFSIVIGVFMLAMGIGAYVSRHIKSNLSDAFVLVQLTLGVAGGATAPVLFFAFAVLENYQAILLVSLLVTGTLVGLEVPLVVRILREHRTLRVNLSNVLSLDYAGALLAALLFPLVLVPQLGLMRTSLLFGLLNVGVAALALWMLRPWVARPVALTLTTAALSAVLVVSLFTTESFERFIETRLYAGEIIHAQTSQYQRIVLSRSGDVINLHLNGGLQFSSIDEYRYHEALVHPVMIAVERRDRILIIGGGDGLAAREVLRYSDVKKVELVDLDPAVTSLFTRNELLTGLNANALNDPRVQVTNADAGQYLESSRDLFDVIIIDLPDPHDIALSRLYTRHFYQSAARRLTAGGALVTQATSPYYATEAFWSIHETLSTSRIETPRQGMLQTIPYHAYVPTFGDWGFIMAGPRLPAWARAPLPEGLRFLDTPTLATLRKFPPDTDRIPVEANTLQTHHLARYYERGWSRWYH